MVALEDDEVYLRGNASEMMMGEDGMDDEDAVEEEDVLKVVDEVVLHVDEIVREEEELVVRSDDDDDVVLREQSAEPGEQDVVMKGVNDAAM